MKINIINIYYKVPGTTIASWPTFEPSLTVDTRISLPSILPMGIYALFLSLLFPLASTGNEFAMETRFDPSPIVLHDFRILQKAGLASSSPLSRRRLLC